MAWLEFHQHVDVAIRSKIVAKHRAEQCESSDVVTPAKCRHGVSIDRNVWLTARSMIRDRRSPTRVGLRVTARPLSDSEWALRLIHCCSCTIVMVQGRMQDLRLAFRALHAAPVVSAVAILSLAIGSGANTALYSLANRLLLRPGAAAAAVGSAQWLQDCSHGARRGSNRHKSYETPERPPWALAGDWRE